jgi:hypothetical protein
MFKLPNKPPRTDKGNLSFLMHPQKPRQLTYAAELGRSADKEVTERLSEGTSERGILWHSSFF